MATDTKTIRQYDGRAASVVFEQVHDQCHEEVGGFAGLVFAGEVALDAIFFHAAKGWVGKDEVDAVFGAVVLERAAQGVYAEEMGVLPGMEELFSLSYIKRYNEQNEYDQSEVLDLGHADLREAADP